MVTKVPAIIATIDNIIMVTLVSLQEDPKILGPVQLTFSGFELPKDQNYR